MIGLAEILPEKEEKYELHRLLSAILSSDLEVNEKLKIMEEEYRIPVENDIREEVEEMCNLSQGIKEKAFEAGQKKGQEKGQEQKLIEMVNKMHEAKLPIEQIADIAEISIDRVRKIIR